MIATAGPARASKSTGAREHGSASPRKRLGMAEKVTRILLKKNTQKKKRGLRMLILI